MMNNINGTFDKEKNLSYEKSVLLNVHTCTYFTYVSKFQCVTRGILFRQQLLMY